MGEPDLGEIRAKLKKLGDASELIVEKRSLDKLSGKPEFLAHILDVHSDRAREWALRTLGDKNLADASLLPKLLELVSDKHSDDEQRALAARVIGTARLDAPAVSVLVNQLGDASPALRIIILEILAKAGSEAAPAVPQLAKYLSNPSAGVQFHAFSAIQAIEHDDKLPDDSTNPAATDHYQIARHLLGQPKTSAESVRSSFAILEDENAPKYLVAVALQRVAIAGHNPKSVVAALRAISDPDEFLSELGANVLDRLSGITPDGIAVLAHGLSDANGNVRLNSALALAKLGPAASQAASAVVATLNRAAKTGANVKEIGTCLDVLRGAGANAEASSAILRLLPEESDIYRNLAKHDVDRLRGFMFITLAETGVSKNAMPFIMGALANSDRASHEFAGAARAAGAAGAGGQETIPFLVSALKEPTRWQFINFEKFGTHVTSTGEYTTCHIEALRALARIGSATEVVVPAVRVFLDEPLPELSGPLHVKRIPNLKKEAMRTLAALEARADN